MKKILLKGYYGFGNLGDDILLKVSFEILSKYFNVEEIHIYSGNTINNQGFSGSPDYNQYVWKILGEKVKLVDWTQEAAYDILFNGGGGLYKDHSVGGKGNAVLNKIIGKLPPQIVYGIEKVVRGLLNKESNIHYRKRIGYGISIGPFTKTSASFVRSYSDIGSYHALFVRDEASTLFLKKHRFSNTYDRVTDIAFHTEYWLDKKVLKKNVQEKKKNIGFILLDWHEHNDLYFTNIKESVKLLRNEGFEVTFFSFQKNFDNKYINAFKDDILVWDPITMSLNDFLVYLNNMHLLVSARAHGAILGACLGIPSICLGITLKLKEVQKMLINSSQLILPPFRSEEVFKIALSMMENYDHIIDALSLDVKINQEKALKAEKELSKVLLYDDK